MNEPVSNVSVIMRSRNSDWVIAQALTGLFAQDFRDFDLLVVDSGSTDRTVEIVQQFPCHLIRIPAADYYPGAVLNQAMERVRAEIVVFQNSDAVPLSSQVLTRLLKPFSDPAVQATFARQVPRPEAKQWVRSDYARAFPASGPAPVWLPLSLPFAAMRRSIWARRPFYTQAWGSEDVEWGYWARRHGQIIRYVPEAVVMHSHNYSLRQLYGRQFIEGEADAFIHGGAVRMPDLLARLGRAVGRQWIDHLQAGAWPEILSVAGRCASAQWGYYRGHRWGEKRIARGDANAAHGQQVVLEHYDD